MHGKHGRDAARSLCCRGYPLCAALVALAAAAWTNPVAASVNYDFGSGAGTTVLAFKGRVPSAIIPPLTNSTPTVEFTGADYAAIASSDDVRYDTGTFSSDDRAATRFVFNLSESSSSITSLTLLWEGRAVSAGIVRVFIWNNGTEAYEQFGSTNSMFVDVSLAQVHSSNIANYVTESKVVTLLALNETSNGGVATDYVRVTVSTCSTDVQCDDNHPCTSDVCDAGTCRHENNSNSCSDGNPCTVNDFCANGVCESGTAPDCSNAGDQCQLASCSPGGQEGNCDVVVPREDGTVCDDGRFCTDGDTCTSGVCGGSPRDCDESVSACAVGFCNEKLAKCESVPVPDGTACDDYLFCTVGDSCTDGTCGGSLRDCLPLADQCHGGVCNEIAAACQAIPFEDGTPCDDGLFCTVADACSSGECTGAGRDCSELADQCNSGLCNESANMCVAQPISDGVDCDDQNACNIGESCLGGACKGGTSPACPGVVGCREIACDPSGLEGNCSHITLLPNGTTCSDGLYCTSQDSCQTGECIGGVSPCAAGLHCDEDNDVCVECLVAADCDDGVACTDDVCVAGVCQITPNHEYCRDNNLFCDGSEYCDAQTDCESTGDPCPVGAFCNEETDTCGECLVDDDCDDLVDCSDDTCVAGGCVYMPNDVFCSVNSLFCDGIEFCDAQFGCIATGYPCLEGDFCNEETDSCDECRTDADCDDGNPCTLEHACVFGTCHAAIPVDCSVESTQCTVATCDPHGEIGNCSIITPVKDGLACDDGFYCTANDRCTAAECRGDARDCAEAGNQCSVGVCNEEIDTCEPHPFDDGVTCDDELFCTIEDSCKGGTCTGRRRDCSSQADQCNFGVCDEVADKCRPLPFIDGTACDDGSYCAVNDVCLGGACHGTARDCEFAADQCNIGICSEKARACVPLPVTDGAPCQDGLACSIGESCQFGLCIGGAAVDCSTTNDECHVASCDPTGPEGNCRNRTVMDDGTTCDDGLYCSLNDVCLAGECLGAERDCSEVGNDCNSGVCNEDSDACEAQPLENGFVCDDRLSCTVSDACKDGRCVGNRIITYDEWFMLTNCLHGPVLAVALECECSDLNGDGQVDLIDAADFQRQFNGQLSSK